MFKRSFRQVWFGFFPPGLFCIFVFVAALFINSLDNQGTKYYIQVF